MRTDLVENYGAKPMTTEWIEDTILKAQRQGFLEPREHLDLMIAMEVRNDEIPEDVYSACAGYRFNDLEIE